MLTTRVRIRNQQWRFDPETGWLRCTCTLLQAGVLTYTRAELRTPPEVRPGAELITIQVPAQEISDPASMQSLEGSPAIAGEHVWQTSESDTNRCGNIAGTPYFDGCDLVGDVLVTDRDVAARIMLPAGDPDKLEEISTAFDSLINWGPGYSDTGASFDGTFSQIRYNHTAILPAGRARGGSAVRIINTTELPNMPDFTRVKLRHGGYVRVMNEDLPAVDDDTKKTDEEVKNAPDAGKLQELMDSVTDLNAQLEALTKQRDEAAGQLQALRDQLDAALDTGAIEAAAANMASDREDADKVMNSRGKKLSDEQRKLHGHGLRVAVLNSIRATPLSEADAKNEAFVTGLYEGVKSMMPATPPAGHQIVNSTSTVPPAAITQMSPEELRRKQYPHLFPAAK